MGDFFDKFGEIQWFGADIVDPRRNGSFFKIDKEQPSFDSLFDKKAFDYCVNCSGAASVGGSFSNPMNDFQLNVVNVFKILEAIRKFSPTTRFINLSSAAVYGNPATLPIRETAPTNPMSPYGHHKKMAEDLCLEFYRTFGLNSLSFRVFSAYGPGLRKQILWDLFTKFQNGGDSVELSGTGEETRDFLHIEDLVRLISLSMDKFPEGASVVNAANGSQVRISELAELVRLQLSSSKAVVFSGISRMGDPLHWEADISQAKRLGFEPKVGIADGVRKYLNWVKS